ncbi:MAG: ABC-type phosphate transport system substrate-binding protein [Oceanicoccus sp.]|jgi:ABC-type phosphate transport system substrate-binding protein
MTMLKVLLSSVLLLFVLGMSSNNSFAEIVIIVHPSNSAADDAKTLKRIFLGKVKDFEGGEPASPVDFAKGSATRSTFNSDFLGKSDAQMKSYWGRLVFTGKATAPDQSSSDEDMIAKVSSNPQLIGYVDAAKVTDAVKVVHRF